VAELGVVVEEALWIVQVPASAEDILAVAAVRLALVAGWDIHVKSIPQGVDVVLD